jgi:hypothetical protein
MASPELLSSARYATRGVSTRELPRSPPPSHELLQCSRTRWATTWELNTHITLRTLEGVAVASCLTDKPPTPGVFVHEKIGRLTTHLSCGRKDKAELIRASFRRTAPHGPPHQLPPALRPRRDPRHDPPRHLSSAQPTLMAAAVNVVFSVTLTSRPDSGTMPIPAPP